MEQKHCCFYFLFWFVVFISCSESNGIRYVAAGAHNVLMCISMFVCILFYFYFPSLFKWCTQDNTKQLTTLFIHHVPPWCNYSFALFFGIIYTYLLWCGCLVLFLIFFSYAGAIWKYQQQEWKQARFWDAPNRLKAFNIP